MTLYQFSLWGIYICGAIAIGFEIYYMVYHHRWERLGTFSAILFMLVSYARILWFPHTFHAGELIRIAIFYLFLNKVILYIFNLIVSYQRRRLGLPSRRSE